MRVADPYREQNERVLRWLKSLSHAEKVVLLKEAGILDKRGDLSPRYRAPEAPKSAKPGSTKPLARKRTAS